MEDLSRLFNEILTTSFDVKSEHWVEITHIINPHDFYVRPTKYRAFVEKIESTKPQTRPSSINLFDIIIFEVNQSGKVKYARGRICNLAKKGDNTKYAIFALDYGYIEKDIDAKHIWKCNDEYSNLITLVQACKLAFCEPIGNKSWSRESIKAFSDFVGNERARIIIKDKTSDKLIVELRNSNPDDIATLMAYTEYSTLGYVHNTINRMSSVPAAKIYYTFKNIKQDETLLVRVQSGKSLEGFYVAEVNDYQNYLKETDNINYYAKKQPSLTPDKMEPGEIILVWSRSNTRDRYERAIIKEIKVPEEKAIVHIVDWGKEEEVHISKMKTISEQCLKIPVLSIYCSADESQIWDNGLHKFLYPGFEFLITIKKLGYKFESPNIVNLSPIPKETSKKLKPRQC